MLRTSEASLVGLIAQSALGKRLRMVSTLPNLPADGVMGRWKVDAPAVYVVPGDGVIRDGEVVPTFMLVMVAAHASGHEAARRGDSQIVGIWEMLESLIAELHGVRFGNSQLLCADWMWMNEEVLRKNGLNACVLRVRGTLDVPAPDTDSLSDFEELYTHWRQVPLAEVADHPLAQALIKTKKGQDNDDG